MFKIIMLVICTLLAPITNADEPIHQKVALILGGGGEPDGPTTNFDRSLLAFGNKLKVAGYESFVTFDRTHVESNKIVDSIDQHATEFTIKGAREKIDQVASRLQTMGKGDQLVVFIDTHGLPKLSGGIGPPTKEPAQSPLHLVVAQDQYEFFDLAELKKLQDAAKAKGIQLAIIDSSCYSGQSLEFHTNDSNTCVITAASEDSVGYSDFAQTLALSLKPGDSLEQSFLGARMLSYEGYPSISTGKGIQAKKDLELLTSWISANSGDAIGTGLFNPNNYCKKSSLEVESQALAFNMITQTSLGLDATSFENLRKDLVAINEAREQTKADTAYGYRQLDIGGSRFLVRSLYDVDRFLNRIRKDLINNPSAQSVAYIKNILAHESELRAKRDELVKTDPNFLRIAKLDQTAFGNVTEREAKLQQMQYRFARFERFAYDKMYRAAKDYGPGKNGFNPCRDFKF